MLQKIDPDGSLSLRSIAERLNQMNVPTISGKGSWSANSVRRLQAVSWSHLVFGKDEVGFVGTRQQ